MPLVQTRGAASAQGFGEFAQATAVNYIEDVFSTYLYTGTGASQTITNGIDLSTKGGLVWAKDRTFANGHQLYDTARGVQKRLMTDQTAAQGTETTGITAFNTTGWTMGAQYEINDSASKYVSWTFRKQPKFFDVVTYTGTGSNTTVAHSLGVVPGSIIVKRTDTTAAWAVYHRSLANTQYLVLNTTAAAATGATWWNSTTPTSAVFSVGTDASVNASGGTYVAYIFAHDAGGFGLTGTDNVISCGSYTGNGSTQQDITLGYEPQWVMIKRTDTTNQWVMVDNMRGFFQTADKALCANTVNAEAADVSMSGAMQPIATGFHFYNANSSVNASGGTYIYIACRRGPMKVPTLGTSVFYPLTRAGTSAVANITGVGFPPDSALIKNRGGAAATVDWSFNFFDKLRAPGYRLSTAFTDAEDTSVNFITSFNQDGISLPSVGYTATNGSYNYINYFFRRAPGFFDEVCYTGTGAIRTISHNLTVAPEWIIVKKRSASASWYVYVASLGASKEMILDLTLAEQSDGADLWNSTNPTSSVFTLGADATVNQSAATYVAYLFATCAGVSKCGSYTGTGTTLQINCGFTAGARFVLIKRTDSTGDWYVWDSARGIVAGNDPYLLLNSTAAEVTSTDYVDTYSAGFEISSTAPAAINASAGSFIFLAIA